jgi:hypothetical protein
MTRVSWWAERALLVAGVATLFALVWHHMAILGDGFWYIATGRLILEHRSLPMADPFSFASTPGQWHVVSVGSQVLFALVADHLGLTALLVLATLVEGTAVAALWLTTARSPLARLSLLPLALLFVQIDAEDLSARGQIFGDLAFVLLLFLITRIREGRRVHAAIPFMLAVFWANLHPSFPLVVLLPLFSAATFLLERFEERAPVRPLVNFAVFALSGCLINPYGPRYLGVVVRLAVDPAAAAFDLFQSPNFHDPSWLLAPAIAIALLVWRSVAGGRWQRSDCALLLTFLAAACVSRRYVTQLVAIEMTVAATLLATSAPPRIARFVVPASGAASVVLLAAAIRWMLEPKDPLQHVPATAAAIVHDRTLATNIMNPLHWGGYLAYAWMGNPRYFIDGRDLLLLFGNGTGDDHLALRRGAPEWMQILDIYDINTVLWERGEPLDSFLAHDPAWSRIHEDWLAVVYVRQRPR